MARVIFTSEQAIFLFQDGDTVESVREAFGDFEWMNDYSDNEAMTGQLIEWRDGSYRATSMSELRDLRDALNDADLSDC
jgi:hypothetical protein